MLMICAKRLGADHFCKVCMQLHISFWREVKTIFVIDGQRCAQLDLVLIIPLKFGWNCLNSVLEEVWQIMTV
jgi:hypothetical protein